MQLSEAFDGAEYIAGRRAGWRRNRSIDAGRGCGSPLWRGLVESLPRRWMARRDNKQLSKACEAVLAGEREGLAPALLLGDTGDQVITRIVNSYPPAPLDREAVGGREKGVTQIVLSARSGGAAQFGRPPWLEGRIRRRREQAHVGDTAQLALRLRLGRARTDEGRLTT